MAIKEENKLKMRYDGQVQDFKNASNYIRNEDDRNRKEKLV